MEISGGADGHDVARHLRAMAERLAGMVESALRAPDISADQARVILHEMATGMEELRVAEEELTVQAEQLAASHLAVDAERERYARLFEFAPDAYLETDGMGKILEANGAAERLLAVPLRFLIGKLVQSFISPRDVRAVRSALARVCESEESVTCETEVDPRDSPPVAVEMRLASHFDPSIEPAGQRRVRWLLRDITERLKLDREVRQLHADVELLAALAEVNRLTAEHPDPVDPLLQGLVELAVRACPESEATITLNDERARVAARAVSSPTARRLDQLQNASGGPGMETGRDKQPRLDHRADLAAWPALAEATAGLGVEWVLSHPITVDVGGSGVFTLYGRGATEDATRAIQLLAEHAAGVIANGRLYRSATTLAEQLEEALESRGVIEQAKGILMAWQGCAPDDAFQILRRASQRENRKLRVIAEDIVAKAVAPRRSGAGPR